VASAPAIFQRTMDTILQGIEGVACNLDDIIITGKSPDTPTGSSTASSESSSASEIAEV